jgi:neutral amino acid transport system permease protein
MFAEVACRFGCRHTLNGEFRLSKTRSLQFVLALVIAGVGLGAAQPAAAADEFGIVVNVFNRTKDDTGKNVRTPVADVEIIVSDAAGAEIARGKTGDDGKFTTPVPDKGSYLVEVNLDNLPEGVVTDEASGVSKQVDVGTGVVVGGVAATTVNFFVGESTRVVGSRLSLLPQAFANGIVLAAIIAICSVGLSLIYGTTGLSNFAHGEIVTIGAVLTWMFNRRLGSWGLIPSAILGIALCTLASGWLERSVWRPLRKRGTSITSMIVVSIGIALAVRYLIQFRLGGGDEFYGIGTQQPVNLGPIDLTPRSLSIIAVSFAVLVGMALFLLRARFGKAIRAVSDNPDLASTTGINTDRVILIVWLLGGALAGLGGVMYGLEFGVSWDMGNILLLLMFAAITLGGLGNAFGALVGSLVIGIFVELWAWAATPDLKTVGALIALIVLLLVKPQGLLGRKERLG